MKEKTKCPKCGTNCGYWNLPLRCGKIVVNRVRAVLNSRPETGRTRMPLERARIG